MKIKKDDYNLIKTSIDKVIKHIGIDKIKQHRALKLGINKDKRFRWDLFYYANSLRRYHNQEEIQVSIYKYADDTHMDTALKHYVNSCILLK